MRLRDQLRQLPAPAWTLFAGTFINRFGSFVVAMLTIYLTRNGYSASQAGLAIGIYGAGHLIASSLGGHLADRIGRRNTIVISMFSSAAAMLALSQAHSFPTILICTLIAGSTTELYRPASYALIGDIVPDEHRVIAFGLYRFAVNLGVAAGPATAGFLADKSFTYVFVGDALTSIIYGIIALVALPEGLKTYQKEERAGEATRNALANSRVVWFLCAAMLTACVDFQMMSTLAVHVTRLGFRPFIYGAMISLNGLLIALFEIAITARVQRLNPQPVIAIGYALNGIGFALSGFARTIPMLMASVGVWTLAEMLYSPMAGPYLIRIAPERFRGRYMGLLVLMWSVGLIIGPIAGMWMFERSETLLWTSCLVVGLISSALMLRGYARTPRGETR
jgi:MFS family permease